MQAPPVPVQKEPNRNVAEKAPMARPSSAMPTAFNPEEQVLKPANMSFQDMMEGALKQAGDNGSGPSAAPNGTAAEDKPSADAAKKEEAHIP